MASSPSIASHKREYEKLYSGTDDWFWQSLESPWYSFVRSHLPALEDKNILEIASGRGAFSCYMSKLKAHVYAVDIAEEALYIGKQRANVERLTTKFVCGSIYDLPFPANFFDIVVSCETLEHLEHPNTGLIEIVRVTKPGGILYLTTENYLNLVGFYRLTLWLRGKKFDSGGGIQPIEQPFVYFSILRLLKSVGMKITMSKASIHQIWIPRAGLHTLDFVSRIWILKRLMKYFGRHVFFVATVEK